MLRFATAWPLRKCGAALAIAGLGAIIACAKTADVNTPYDPSDSKAVDQPFDKNELLQPGAFTDTLTLDSPTLQRFLERTPYNHASFLSTYQSNGVRAADALVNAGQAHGINPLVILVRAEIDQGLVAAQFYPFPPSRVEYVFNCGCPGAGQTCDPQLAGFDRQADCYARELRASLQEIAANGRTASGWGPSMTTATLDGVKVTPGDASTAALYAYEPIVGAGTRGGWLFWNVWQIYANFLEYDGPVGTSSSQAWIGDACASDPTSCAGIPNGFCATNFPSGLCTVDCTKDPCPSDPNHPETFCADFGQAGGYCLAECNRGVPGTCREGFECKSVYAYGSKDTARDACVASN